MAQFADTDTNVTASQDAFAQTATSSSQSYELYQNNDFGFSIQYPSNWSYNQDFSKSSYGFVTFYPNDKAGNIAFQIIFIKDEIQTYRGLQGQAYLNTMVSDISSDCSAKSITISGYQCSDFKLLDSKVASYQGGPAYDVAYSWTEKEKNGNVYSMYTGVQWIPDANHRWVLSLIGIFDKSSKYQDVIGNMANSFELNNYTLPTILPAESQNNQATQNNVPQNIPDWIRNNAKWWAEGSISDNDFVKGVQYMIQQRIIIVLATQATANPSNIIPSWIKNNAKWWAEGQVADADFIKGLQYLVQNGIVTVQSGEGIGQQSSVQQQSYGGYNSWEDYCQATYGSSSHYDSSQYKCIQSTSGMQSGGGGTSSGPGQQQGGTNALGIDLTGHYQGHIQGSFTTDYYNPSKGSEHLNCQYEGTVFIGLAQRADPTLVDGNVDARNSVTIMGDSDCQNFPGAVLWGPLSATVSGSGFSGKVGTLDLNAQFTTDLLKGTFSGDIGVISTHGEFTASRTG